MLIIINIYNSLPRQPICTQSKSKLPNIPPRSAALTAIGFPL